MPNSFQILLTSNQINKLSHSQDYRVTLSIAQLGSLKYFPGSCYISILLAWAECHLKLCQAANRNLQGRVQQNLVGDRQCYHIEWRHYT